MNELEMWMTYLRTLHASMGARDERGEIAQNTIWIALMAGAAITIAGIVIAKFTGKANTIPTGP